MPLLKTQKKVKKGKKQQPRKSEIKSKKNGRQQPKPKVAPKKKFKPATQQVIESETEAGLDGYVLEEDFLDDELELDEVDDTDYEPEEELDGKA